MTWDDLYDFAEIGTTFEQDIIYTYSFPEPPDFIIAGFNTYRIFNELLFGWEFAKPERITGRKRRQHGSEHKRKYNLYHVDGCYSMYFRDGSPARKFFKRQTSKRSRINAYREIQDQLNQEAEELEPSIYDLCYNESQDWFEYQFEPDTKDQEIDDLDGSCYYDYFNDDPFHDEDFSASDYFDEPYYPFYDWYEPTSIVIIEQPKSIHETDPEYIDLYLAGKV